MTINEAVRIVRERGRIVLLCLLLGLLGAGAVVALTPRMYAADVSLYVSPAGRAENSDDAYKASQLAKDRVTSYAPLMRDERVTQAVVDKLQLPMTADQLASHLTVTVEPESVVMVARVTDSSPERAAAIANAVASEFVGLVTQLEQPFGSGSSSSSAAPSAPGRQQPAPQPTSTQIKPEVIRQALPSPVPVSPIVPFDMSLGAALGLLVGLGAAFLSHARDRSIRDPERLAALASAGVLAEIPEDRGTKRYPIAFDQSPEPPRAETYRRLRTNLQFHRAAPRSTGAKVVVVTSAAIGDGTSVTACNLACALAASSRVILIDANLRHPQVESYLTVEPGAGLTTVLTGSLPRTFSRRKHSNIPLDVLPSGPVGPRLGELLTWHRMDELLHELRRRYDFVIIDAPALLPVSDAAAVAARADGAILVVRYRSTTEEQVAAAVDALKAVSTPLVGTVLNMVPAQQLRRTRVKGYAERRSPNLPPMLSAPNPPAPPPARRGPLEPSSVPARNAPPPVRPGGPLEPANGSARKVPPPVRPGPVEPANGSARSAPPPVRPGGALEPANGSARKVPPPPRPGPVEAANGSARNTPPADRRGPVEPANVSANHEGGRRPDSSDEPSADSSKK